MKAFLEINAGVIRVLPKDSVYGDVFEFAIFLVGDEDTAILKGLRMDDHRFTMRHKKAIMECLLEAGFTRACWDRYKGANREKRKFVVELKGRASPKSFLRTMEIPADRTAVAA